MFVHQQTNLFFLFWLLDLKTIFLVVLLLLHHYSINIVLVLGLVLILRPALTTLPPPPSTRGSLATLTATGTTGPR